MAPFDVHLSRFDRAVLLVLLGLGLLTGILVWQGSRSHARLAAVDAAPYRIAYLAPDEQGADQLFAAGLTGDQPEQLTREPLGVHSYTISPGAGTIAYAAPREDGGHDLWAINPDGSGRRSVLACPAHDCTGVRWHPDGRRLVYERRTLAGQGEAQGAPGLWWLDVAKGDTIPVFADDQVTRFDASWSPDGEWLSFASPAEGGMQVYHLAERRNLVLLAQVGEPAVWSPQGDALLFTDVRSAEGRFAIHLLKLVLESNQMTDLSGEAEAFDDSPAWSPDGAWIAFGRKEVVGPRASMGYQVWTMRSDGSQARPLTADMDIHPRTLAWSPDGRFLLFQHTPLAEPGTPPSVWLLEVENGDLRRIAMPGRQPAWLP
jgi:TolB protein